MYFSRLPKKMLDLVSKGYARNTRLRVPLLSVTDFLMAGYPDPHCFSRPLRSKEDWLIPHIVFSHPEQAEKLIR